MTKKILVNVLFLLGIILIFWSFPWTRSIFDSGNEPLVNGKLPSKQSIDNTFEFSYFIAGLLFTALKAYETYQKTVLNAYEIEDKKNKRRRKNKK